MCLRSFGFHINGFRIQTFKNYVDLVSYNFKNCEKFLKRKD